MNNNYDAEDQIALKTLSFILKQNKGTESCLLQKDFDNALIELYKINEKIENCTKALTLLRFFQGNSAD